MTTRIFLALMMGLLGLASAGAEHAPPVCMGRDLLAELRAKNPDAYAVFKADMAKVPNAEGLLWRIEKEGQPVSHLFGTVHLTDPRVTAFPNEVTEALDGSEILALELAAIGDLKGEATMTAMSLVRGMNIANKPQLIDFTDEERSRLMRALAARGVPAKAIQSVKPWFLTILLATPACEFERTKLKIDTVDEVIAKRARERSIEVVGLETNIEQLKVLTGIKPWIYKASLRDMTRAEGRIEDVTETLVQLYIDRRVGGLLPAYPHILLPEENLKASLGLIDTLMGSRNGLMKERALPLLAKGRTFIAVGALHLSGDGGLVELLRKEGYQLTRIW